MLRKLIARFRAWLDEGLDDSDPPIDQPRDERDKIADQLERDGRVW